MNHRINIIKVIIFCAFCTFIYGCSTSDNRIGSSNVTVGGTANSENKPSSSIEKADGTLLVVDDKLTLSKPDDYTSQGTGIIRKESDIEALFNALDIMKIDDSTCFSAIGYSKTNEIFYCKFLDGGSEYIYLDVPETVYKELMAADSKGSYFNSSIKPNYECRKVER